MADPYNFSANVSGSKTAAPKPATAGLAQLMPADPKKGYATPYYAAYTNDGDFAGAVMVADGQKVRLVDKMTGDVVYEGVGPQAAEIATATANAISKDKGRGAAWAIQNFSDDRGWTSMAEERWDPKKQGFWGKLADIALPVLGAILAPMTGGLSLGLTGALGTAVASGLGAAGGSLLGSATNRRDFDDALKRAAVSGLTAGATSAVLPAVGSALAKAPENAVTNALNAGYRTIMAPANAGVRAVQNAAGAAGKAIQGGWNAATGELIVTPGVSGLTGGAIGSAAANTATNSFGGSSDQNVLLGGDTGTTFDDLTVPGSNTDPVTGGVLGGVLNLDYSKVGNEYTDVGKTDTPVDELTVTANKLDGVAVPVGDLDAGQISAAVEKGVGFETPTADELLNKEEGLGARLLEWAKANPALAARLGLSAASLLGLTGSGGSGSSGGGGGIPPGFAAAGTPGSLSDKFRAQLPAPSGSFGNLTARDVSMTPEEWKTYGARPEQSFFANVPIRPSGISSVKPPGGRVVEPRVNPAEMEPGLTVANVSTAPSSVSSTTGADMGFAASLPATRGRPLGVQGAAPSQPVQGFNPAAPSSVNSTSDSDMNRSRMTPEQFAVAMQRMEDARRAPPLPKPSIEPKFAKGGFAVRGPGTGRSDDIPARLSDGEYVIDAETVALLGDGSSQAGSKRLDEFRANIRKHKGRQLAKGKFSHDARKPEAYLYGGQV